MDIREERMGGLTKWYLDLPIPAHAVFHHIPHPDGSEPHDHPWPFCSFVYEGWYTEEIFTPRGTSYRIIHNQYDVIHYDEDHIHRITNVSPGGVYTLIKVAPHLPQKTIYIYKWEEEIMWRQVQTRDQPWEKC